jgi:molybdenum cofactor synthesis domain-containing protein
MSERTPPTALSAAILTISDRGARGERQDVSGPRIRTLIEALPAEVSVYEVIPDDEDVIVDRLRQYSATRSVDVIVTTGGTGVGPRDVTPEATRKVIDKELLGFEIAMILESLKKTPHGMISRAVVGMRNQTLIINLPGNPKAVEENLRAILPALPHTVAKMKGDPSECGA